MSITLKVLTATAALSLCSAQAWAEPLQTGRSTYLHHHYHASHHYEMTHRNHRNADTGTAYGVGSGSSPRTTATGGNPGGYSSRN